MARKRQEAATYHETTIANIALVFALISIPCMNMAGAGSYSAFFWVFESKDVLEWYRQGFFVFGFSLVVVSALCNFLSGIFVFLKGHLRFWRLFPLIASASNFLAAAIFLSSPIIIAGNFDLALAPALGVGFYLPGIFLFLAWLFDLFILVKSSRI